MSEFAAVVLVEVFKTNPPRYRGKARRQPWRWRIVVEGNRRILASSEAYTNETDAISAARLACSYASTAFLVRDEHGYELIRRASDVAPQ